MRNLHYKPTGYITPQFMTYAMLLQNKLFTYMPKNKSNTFLYQFLHYCKITEKYFFPSFVTKKFTKFTTNFIVIIRAYFTLSCNVLRLHYAGSTVDTFHLRWNNYKWSRKELWWKVILQNSTSKLSSTLLSDMMAITDYL